MNLAIYGYGLAAVTYTGLAIALAAGLGRDGSSRRIHGALLAAVATSAVWAWFGALGGSVLRAHAGLVHSLLDVGRYALWFHFLLAVLGKSDTPTLRHRFLAVVSWALTVVAGVMLILADGHPAATRSVASLLLFAMLSLPVFGLVLLEQLFRAVPDDFRWHAKPICLALLCLLAFDIYLYSQVILFGTVDSDSLAVRPVVHAAACLLLFAAARRQSNWMGSLHVSHSAAMHTLTLVLVGLYLVFISAIGYYVRHFGGDAGRGLQIGLLCIALLALALLLASASLRARFRVFISKNFFNYRYDYRTEWLRFTALLSTKGSPREVGSVIVRGLADLLHSRGGAMWSANLEQDDYVQTVHWNVDASIETEPTSSTFARFLLEQEWIVDLDEYRTTPKRYDGVTIPDWLVYSSQYWLVIPLIGGERLVGFVALSRAGASPQLNWEVRDLLKTAARQAAGFLAQMQVTEALLEARKFDAFNRMSAFVVHDLKNIVAQLSLMLQNAKRLQDNPEFRQDMLMTVEHSLEKMKQLMLQLREGNVPAGVTLGVELLPIARGILTMASQRGRTVELEAAEPLVARGHDERIARVVGHVVQNALDATPVDGRVWLRIERAGGSARVVVGDTGCGMTQDFIRSRLFKPFNTTKQNGMGIGAFESFQYIRELGGRIDVDSAVGRGTVISIHLPLFEMERRVDVEPVRAS
jgi:putative PEP-CTERM system histidine kinase